MSRAGEAAVAMLDAIVAVRKPYDEQQPRGRRRQGPRDPREGRGLRQARTEEQDKKLEAETKANLLALWRRRVAKDPGLKELGELQRAAQWRLDFVAAENSMGFHAPQEMARILAESIDLSRQAEIQAASLQKGPLAMNEPAPAPGKVGR